MKNTDLVWHDKNPELYPETEYTRIARQTFIDWHLKYTPTFKIYQMPTGSFYPDWRVRMYNNEDVPERMPILLDAFHKRGISARIVVQKQWRTRDWLELEYAEQWKEKLSPNCYKQTWFPTYYLECWAEDPNDIMNVTDITKIMTHILCFDKTSETLGF